MLYLPSRLAACAGSDGSNARLLAGLAIVLAVSSSAATFGAQPQGDLLTFLLAENARTMSKIRTAQYHVEETRALPSRSPEVRPLSVDVVREGANAWWCMRVGLKDLKTGVTTLQSIVVVRTRTGATTWYENTAQATMYEADENGVLPKRSAFAISVKEPFDIFKAVAAHGDGPLGRFIAASSAPPRTVTAERDVKDASIFYITTHALGFEGPTAQAVLDARKGYLMATMTSYWAPRVVAQVVRAEVAQVGKDVLWFPTSYEQVDYDRDQPQTATHRQTSELSNIVLNEPLPADAFAISRLNFPDGLKVVIKPVAGDGRLMFWFKGNLLAEDDYMALDRR